MHLGHLKFTFLGGLLAQPILLVVQPILPVVHHTVNFENKANLRPVAKGNSLVFDKK